MAGRPRKMDATMLRMVMRTMANRGTVAQDLAKCLGMATTTLYRYVSSNGTVKEPGQKVLDTIGEA